MRRVLRFSVVALALLGACSLRADEKPKIQLLPKDSTERAAPEAVPPASVVEPPACAVECPSFDWAKVPPVRPLPRLGWYNLPPEHCGYYTLVDALRRRPHEGPPKGPYAPISPSAGSFFDADYRFLEDPNFAGRDWTDRFHRIHLGDDWLLSTGGEFRYRLMDELGARLTAVNDNYNLIRTRVYGDLWYRDRVRFYMEFLEGHSFSNDLAPRQIDVNPAEIQNLFADVKLLEAFGSPYVRVGRQEMNYGSQRLISPADWANARRTFQGAKVFWNCEKWDVDLFWVKPVLVDAGQLDWWDLDQNFYGVWATYKPKKGTARDFYVLNLAQNRPVAVGAGGLPGGFYLTTFGTRWVGDHDGRFLYDVELNGQTGTQANAAVAAFSATAGLGYRAKGLRLNPTVWAYYDYASGTPDPAINGTSQTFNPLFPFGHYYLGYLDLVGRQNIHDFNLQVSINPMPFMTVLFQYHHFALASARDALYNAAGAVSRVDPTGASGRHVGDEFDFWTNVHINRHHDVAFGFSYLAPGAFLQNAPPGVPVTPALFYMQYSYKW